MQPCESIFVLNNIISFRDCTMLGHFSTRLILSLIIALTCLQYPLTTISQETDLCPEYKNNRADKVYDKAIRAFRQRDYSMSIRLLNDVIDIEPDYVDAYFVLGLIYIKERRMNLPEARENFLKVVQICPTYDVYAYYHLARIAYGSQDYGAALDFVSVFLDDVDLIKSDEDYNDAITLQDFSKFYDELLKESSTL